MILLTSRSSGLAGHFPVESHRSRTAVIAWVPGRWRVSGGLGWLRPGIGPITLSLVLLAGGGCGSGESARSVSSAASLPVGTAALVSATIPRPGDGAGQAEAVAPAKVGIDGVALYQRLCETCHGDQGDGNGLAARFLYPQPRNFRSGSFRFVTSVNAVPSDQDLDRVLSLGLPGSAMFPYGHLSQDERKALIEVIRNFMREGVVERVKREAAEFDEEVDPDELASILKTRLEAGDRVEIPADPPAPDRASIERGRELYVKSCATCHGDTGKGDGVQEQKDESGVPIRPRDFTRGVFKGGRDRDQLYARVVLGVPGTPMPASPQLKPNETGDMINYILSLSDPAASAKVQHKRRRIVARKPPNPLGNPIAESAWAGDSVPIVISPLWWRDGAEPDLRVQAIHDGREIAIRLTWKDETRGESAIRPQDFADMAAVELFGGEPSNEPFLGMGGGQGGAVDLWLWSAAVQADRKEYQDVDTVYPNMVVDEYPFEKLGGAPRPHRTDLQPRKFVSAWEVGNQRSDPTRVLSGSNLQSEGLGSTSFRPRPSQVVAAEGGWRDGVWSVVLRRPLTVEPATGVSIPPGARRSIGFAIWDGSAQDRGSQKLVSIWHDLVLD